MNKRKLVQIILYDEEKKVLLQMRDDKAENNPNTLGLFGGGIKAGETPEIAVKRECKEELDYELKNPKLLDKALNVKEAKADERYVYVEKYDEASKLKCGEGKGFKWMNLDEVIKDKKIKECDKKVISKF